MIQQVQILETHDRLFKICSLDGTQLEEPLTASEVETQLSVWLYKHSMGQCPSKPVVSYDERECV